MDVKDKEITIAEYNMGQLDYIRIDELLKQLHNYALEIKKVENNKMLDKLIIGFCSVLEEVFAEIRPALSKEKKEKYDREFETMFVNVINWSDENKKTINPKTPWKTLISPLWKLRNEILEEKHQIMGFPILKTKPLGQKIRSGLNV